MRYSALGISRLSDAIEVVQHHRRSCSKGSKVDVVYATRVNVFICLLGDRLKTSADLENARNPVAAIYRWTVTRGTIDISQVSSSGHLRSTGHLDHSAELAVTSRTNPGTSSAETEASGPW